jgi:hypothetical protein
MDIQLTRGDKTSISIGAYYILTVTSQMETGPNIVKEMIVDSVSDRSIKQLKDFLCLLLSLDQLSTRKKHSVLDNLDQWIWETEGIDIDDDILDILLTWDDSVDGWGVPTFTLAMIQDDGVYEVNIKTG